MNVPLSCPHAVYKDGMRIFCKKVNGWCGNQRFKPCKGWWVLTNWADACQIRKKGEPK